MLANFWQQEKLWFCYSACKQSIYTFSFTEVPGYERGTLPGEKRKCYIVNEKLASQIDATACWGRIKIKDAVKNAFTDYIT